MNVRVYTLRTILFATQKLRPNALTELFTFENVSNVNNLFKSHTPHNLTVFGFPPHNYAHQRTHLRETRRRTRKGMEFRRSVNRINEIL